VADGLKLTEDLGWFEIGFTKLRTSIIPDTIIRVICVMIAKLYSIKHTLPCSSAEFRCQISPDGSLLQSVTDCANEVNYR